MKKLLALVLALVMTLSLCVTSNAAYTDAADIDYTEAVDVLTTIGVFQGSDGKFDAKANLTREQAAKLVAYLQIGQKAADALVGSGKFTDVAKTAWSAGYVDYCASTGIVNGVGGGLFNPAGSLTALQFGKMLLVCLGYDAKAEGLVGADWEINVSKLMASNDLLKGLDEVTAYSVVTREQAAKMMLNALMAPMVEYKNKATSISVNGADIEFGGSTASYVTDKISSAGHIKTDKANDNSLYILELGEKLYPTLEITDWEDDFGRPARGWSYKNTKIGTYLTDTAYLTYTSDMSSTANKKVVTKALKDYDLDETVVYANGLVTNWVAAVGDVPAHYSGTTAAKIADYTGNGILVEVYTDGTDVEKVVVIRSFLGKVTKVNDTDETITVTLQDGSDSDKIVTDDYYGVFEKDAYVMVSPFFKNAAGTSIEKDACALVAAEKVSGKVTAATGTKVTVDGTAYTVAEDNYYAEPGLKDEVDVYLDAYGYAVKTSGIAAKDFIYLVAKYTKSDDFSESSVYGQFVDTEGNVKIYKIAKVNSTDVTINNYTSDETGLNTGRLYSYSVSNNKVTLTAAAEAGTSKAYVTYALSQPVTSSTKSLKVGSETKATRYFSDETVVISVKGDKGDLKVSVNTGKQLVKDDANYAIITSAEKKSSANADIAIVFVNAGVITNNTDLIFTKDADKDGYATLGETDYDTYEAYINGEKDTIAVEKFYYNTSSNGNFALYTYGTNADGAYVLTEKAFDDNYVKNAKVDGVYKNDLSVENALGEDVVLNCSNATIVDLTDNGIADMADLKAVCDIDAAEVYVTASYNKDDEVTVLYVNAAKVAFEEDPEDTYTLTDEFDGDELETISYKDGGKTKVVTVNYFTADDFKDVKVSTIDGWTFTGYVAVPV